MRTTSIKLPKKMHAKLIEQVIKDGYGMRGKSKWVNDAIEDFLNLDDYPEMVDIATDLEELEDTLSIRLPEAILDAIDLAIIHIRQSYPTIEGVKSNIIRASILQRLIRATSVTEV